jgi:thiamine transporter ThiT
MEAFYYTYLWISVLIGGYVTCSSLVNREIRLSSAALGTIFFPGVISILVCHVIGIIFWKIYDWGVKKDKVIWKKKE